MKQSRLFGIVLTVALAVLFFTAVTPAVVSAATIYVPEGGNQTIQQAVNNATAGDTIIVRDGTYNENVNVDVNHLTIRSENGSANCIVNAAILGDHVFEVTADWVNLSGFTVENATGGDKTGIYLGSGVEHCNISDNTASNNHHGVWLDYSSNNTLTNNTANSNNDGGIWLYYSSNNTLMNNTMSGNTYNFAFFGEYLSHYIQNIDTSNKVGGKPIYYWVNQKNKQIPSNAGFVGIVNSTNITVKDLTLTKNGEGVLFAYTDNSKIENVTASNDFFGIYLRSSSNNTIANNHASNNYHGIWLEGSSINNFINNTVNSNECDGIKLEDSSTNNFTDNTMSGNTYNFGIIGVSLSHYIQNIDMSNKVDGKPIYYWVNQQDQQVPNDAGFVGIVNSTNITVEDLTLTKNKEGVLFAYTDNSRIENVTASNNSYGIYLDSSSNNEFTNNIANSNTRYGFYLYNADDNNITCNWVAYNEQRGFYLTYGITGSTGNNISLNNIMFNGADQGDGSYRWNFYNDQSYDVNAAENYWGTNNETKINASIFDFYNDATKGKVDFSDYKLGAVPCAPIPDLSAIVLFGVGLLVLAGYVRIRIERKG